MPQEKILIDCNRTKCFDISHRRSVLLAITWKMVYNLSWEKGLIECYRKRFILVVTGKWFWFGKVSDQTWQKIISSVLGKSHVVRHMKGSCYLYNTVLLQSFSATLFNWFAQSGLSGNVCWNLKYSDLWISL